MKTAARSPVSARRSDPKGQVLILFALVLVVLLLVSALAVDYGGWLLTKRNYQNYSDAAALAGAQQLTRPLGTACSSGPSKTFCARQAAWESIKAQLGLPTLNPVLQAAGPGGFQTPWVEKDYSIWVASPPSDAGNAYLGHISGPGNIYVRVDHLGSAYLSRIGGINKTITGWATAGRFPANFAVIAMCSPTSITASCLAGDSNIKLDGNNTNLIVDTGDLGTNRWTKSGGNSSGVALGADSNAYMQLFDSCWNAGGNQCNLFGYTSPNIDYSATRAAVPLGAPIPDPAYAPPPITSTTAPNQCRGTGTVQLASTQVLEQQAPHYVADLPIKLASVVVPSGPDPVISAANVTVSGVVKAQVGSAPIPGIVVTSSPDNGNSTTNASGAYSMSIKTNTTYTLTATDPTGVYNTTTATVVVGSGNVTVPDIFMRKNPVVSGTVTSTTTGLPLNGVTVTITILGNTYTATTNASGLYTRTVPVAGNTVAYTIAGTLTGYASGSAMVPAPTAYDTNYPNKDFTMTVTPATLSGTIMDAVPNPTNLPVPGIVVTLGTGQTTTTDASGNYTFASATVGTTTITLSGTSMVGYAYSTPVSGSSITLNAGSNTRNFTVWPKGCYDGGSSGSFGSWTCSWPSGNNCPATTNPDGADVRCTFTQANAIRPGTYGNITLPNGTCAWFDPRGGVTGLPSGQSAGIYHIKGNIDIGNGSYLFGDGVTLVFDQGSSIDVGNSGGFVLNYGSVASGSPLVCNLATVKAFNDGNTPCFRTVTPIDSQDYAYTAWTTKGHTPWACSGTQASPPLYSDSCVQKGQELGITFYMYGSGLGNQSRFKIATANMGYLFNGVLYAPGDDIQLGGGKNGQTAAGQIVGWTIEYHGGTRVLQSWYGSPVDGQPFLIEPIIGE